MNMKNYSKNQQVNCNLELPYPKICVEGQNLNYGRILLPLYAGKSGELTAISQYIYQYIILEKDALNIAEIIECISITEMKHFKILGELILLLGGDPKLRTMNNLRQNYWSGEYTNYSHSIPRILLENIQSEKKGISAYTNAIHEIKDECVTAIIKRIILDEEHHVEIFTNLINSEKQNSSD